MIRVSPFCISNACADPRLHLFLHKAPPPAPLPQVLLQLNHARARTHTHVQVSTDFHLCTHPCKQALIFTYPHTASHLTRYWLHSLLPLRGSSYRKTILDIEERGEMKEMKGVGTGCSRSVCQCWAEWDGAGCAA